MLFTFLLNNYFSFKDRKKTSFVELLGYFVFYSLSSLVPVFARGYIIYLFVYEFGDTLLIRNIAFFIGIFIGLIWNYTVYSRIIWKKNVKI
jgi:putative flippase GtrA